MASAIRWNTADWGLLPPVLPPLLLLTWATTGASRSSMSMVNVTWHFSGQWSTGLPVAERLLSKRSEWKTRAQATASTDDVSEVSWQITEICSLLLCLPTGGSRGLLRGWRRLQGWQLLYNIRAQLCGLCSRRLLQGRWPAAAAAAAAASALALIGHASPAHEDGSAGWKPSGRWSKLAAA